MHIPSSVKLTLKIQPAVILFSTVSILAKLASGLLPKGELSITEKMVAVVTDWRILGLVSLMFMILAAYAVVWQILIKNAQIAVIYANKSSYLLWAQLSAVLFFGEHISWTNIIGIIVIFSGIMLANCGGARHEQA